MKIDSNSTFFQRSFRKNFYHDNISEYQRLCEYSLIPVHAWSHDYSDVITVVESLNSMGGFQVLLPNDFVTKITKNLS